MRHQIGKRHAIGRGRRGQPVEPHDIANHAPEGRAHGIARLSQKGAGATQRIFDAPVIQRRAKAHVALLHWHIKFVEQPAELIVEVGNRLVVAVDFDRHIVWIKWIGMHEDYDRIDVTEVEHGD